MKLTMCVCSFPRTTYIISQLLSVRTLQLSRPRRPSEDVEEEEQVENNPLSEKCRRLRKALLLEDRSDSTKAFFKLFVPSLVVSPSSKWDETRRDL